MPQVIVGSLFVLIIITAGWLVGFYNMMTNKKIKAEDCYETLIMNKAADAIEPRMIEANIRSYNQVVTEYNEYLRRFPNCLACMILGVRELSYYEQGGKQIQA